MSTKDQPEMVVVGFTVDVRLAEELRARAAREDRSMSSLVRLALNAWFKAHPAEPTEAVERTGT